MNCSRQKYSLSAVALSGDAMAAHKQGSAVVRHLKSGWNTQTACFMLIALVIIALLPSNAYAQTSSVATVLCTIVGWFQGIIGKTIAVLAVMSLGITTMFGRTQISSLFIVLTGVALIFGAQGILTALNVSSGCSSTGGSTVINIVSSPLNGVLICTVAILDGGIARGLASLAIILLGLFALWGRISWHQATLVAVGIAAVFGASGIVNAMGVVVNGTNAPLSGLAMAACPTFATSNASFLFSNSLEKVFCNVLGWFNGPIGKGVTTVAMIILGLGALFGKVGWDKTIVIGIGVALIFGATGIVDALGGGGSITTTATTGRANCDAGLFP